MAGLVEGVEHPYSHGLYSYGLYSHGLYSYGTSGRGAECMDTRKTEAFANLKSVLPRQVMPDQPIHWLVDCARLGYIHFFGLPFIIYL